MVELVHFKQNYIINCAFISIFIFIPNKLIDNHWRFYMKKDEQHIETHLLDDAFSKYQKNDKPNPENLIPKKVSNKMVIESDSGEQDEELIKAMNQKKKASQNVPSANENLNGASRKRVPQSSSAANIPNQKNGMQIQQKQKKLLTFSELQQEVRFYLTEVYQFSQNKLFLTGVMQNGQTISFVANQTYRQLYFALKKEEFDTEQVSQEFMQKAKKEIDDRLRRQNIKIQMGDFEEKQYVFQIDGVCRKKRPYYKVRYSFDNLKVPQPDEEGTYYKYVFGTTYTPLELFILNTGVKGPCWVKVNKIFLKQTPQVKKMISSGLCLQIQIAESIELVRQITKPPYLRVMSLSLKTAVPSNINKRQLFPNTTRLDENHIYCISYTFCEEYEVQLKPPTYNQIQKVLYLKSFGNFNQKGFEAFDTEDKMFGNFIADLNRLDPDVIVCHDASKILDTLIQRMAQIGDKNQKPKLGRLVYHYNLSSSNQHQRINSALAGRLLVDTFIHSKDMIKSVDYELQNMTKHIKPEKNFSGMSEEQVKNFLQSGKTIYVLNKIRDEADVCFALMNHLQVLQLTRNLSNICGNLWRRSLQNQRAERNEFLIMHECIRQNLIIPDKFRISKNQEDGEEVDRKKYAGGMVIEPKKGMYNDFIILLDFNSLYPSIIRQYNVCFSKLERPRIPLSKFYKPRKANKQGKKGEKVKEEQKEVKKQAQDEDMQFINPPPKQQCTKKKWGFLPRLIDGIVNQRQKCKKAMKTASAEKCIILDIQQKSYKIVANSIYGCLGFSISRFYSKPMAALITRMGRQALQRANDIVSSRGGVQVIYGDTDSLMIQPISLNKQTDKEKLFEIKAIADELKKSINKEYENLQIDIDGIFKPILLLMKKKYVANKLQNFDKIIAGIDQQLKFNLQFKGIEVVRRDGCEVSRASLKRILEILMNSKKDDVGEIYEEIYEYARQLNEKLLSLSSKDFLFSKQLNKKPKQYANGESLPHVKVAMDRVRNGEKQQTLVNHTIYYLVCKPKLESQDSIAKRCFDEKTLERSIKFSKDPKQMLEIDFDYYKQQILQPWMRIFIHLEEFNLQKLFEAFDVKDAERKIIRKLISNERDYIDNGLQDFLTNDMKEKSKKFNQQISGITCSNCQNAIEFSQNGQIMTNCKYCPVENTKLMTSILSNKISMWIKQKSALYYTNKHKCECQKVYPLTLINQCCRVQSEKKTIIPFEIHTFVYLVKELIDVTITKLDQKLFSSKKEFSDELSKETINLAKERLTSIKKKVLDNFLESSDFENLDGMFEMFRI